MGAGTIDPENSPTPNTSSSLITSAWLHDFLAQPVPATPWLIYPWLPSGGTVFFHGPTSVGKSPFTWKLASCVSNGSPFFGWPVQQTGNVLYLEFDTPPNLIHQRLRALEDKPERMFLVVLPKLNVTNPLSTDSRILEGLQKNIAPVLVIVNTLRKAHSLDDRASDTPSIVYSAFRRYFPSATLFFVHHDKKNGDPKVVNPDQAFSGSQHWADDAQIALHITRIKKGPEPETVGSDDLEPAAHEKSRVQVKMTKSQVSDHEAFDPLLLQLSPDGSNWIQTGPEQYRTYFRTLPKELSRADRIKLVEAKFGIQKSASHQALKGLH